MELILVDELSIDEFYVIKAAKESPTSVVNKVSDAAAKDLILYDKITVYAGLELGFVSSKLLSFICEIEKNNISISLDVVIVSKLGENTKFVAEWMCSMVSKFRITAEISRENLKDELAGLLKPETENKVTIYTDGACSGNPGAGGWGAILMTKNKTKEISGFDPNTTNNKMELLAVIEALKLLKAPCKVELYSDSAYVVNAMNLGWLDNWKNNGWKGSDKKEVKNIELWKQLDSLLAVHSVNFIKVKGHADNKFNNRCDELATGEISKHANQI